VAVVPRVRRLSTRGAVRALALAPLVLLVGCYAWGHLPDDPAGEGDSTIVLSAQTSCRRDWPFARVLDVERRQDGGYCYSCSWLPGIDVDVGTGCR
jgi:hypothetical protein